MPKINLKAKYMVFLLLARVDTHSLIKKLIKYYKKHKNHNIRWEDLKDLLESCEI